MRHPLSVLFILIAFPAWGATLDFAIIGDAGEWNKNSESVRDSIHRSGVKNLILPGDNLYDTGKGYDQAWQPWHNLGFLFDLVAIGNHTAGHEEEVDYFKMPGAFYSKTYLGMTRFIVLNSDVVFDVKPQEEFLERELEQATEPLVFLVYHHPSYDVAPRGHKWWERAHFQRAIRPLIWKYRHKLTALIVGHDHLASLLHFNDLPVILSGAVKSVREDGPTDHTQSGVRVKTAWLFDMTPHWARLQLDSTQNIATVHFVKASDDRVPCRAALSTGFSAVLSNQCQ
jgi:hypothetical protein